MQDVAWIRQDSLKRECRCYLIVGLKKEAYPSTYHRLESVPLLLSGEDSPDGVGVGGGGAARRILGYLEPRTVRLCIKEEATPISLYIILWCFEQQL